MFVGCNINRASTPLPPLPTITRAIDTTPDWYPSPTDVHCKPPSDDVTYIHFAPSEGSKIRLEFDYPTSWIFSRQIYSENPRIFLGDPRILYLPTPSPDSFHPAPHDYGSIFIRIIESKPGRTVESETEDQKQRYRGVGWANFLKEYKVAIDGFGARVIEHQIQKPDTHTSVMFERRIYFFAENEIYSIIFEIAEKERCGEFEQGYEYFFKSLKIVP